LNSLVCFFLPLGKTLEQIWGAMVPSLSFLMNQLLIVFEYWEYGGDGGEDVAKRFEAEQLLSFLPAVRIG